jgi:threonine aldolase
MRYIDLRSDTVTRPSEEMRRAMATAEVGDDVFNDDPTVIRLEKIVAEMFGREASLFVPSGTMGNQVCLKTLTHAGDEVICDEGAHIFNYEVATAAAFSGLLFHVVRGVRGVMTAAEIRPLIRPLDIHAPRTKVIAIENTHNRAGGTIFPLEEMEAIRNLADETGLVVHLDGARIWNAHIATGIPLTEYGRLADTLSVCLSKGLGAPIGSMAIGDQ